MKKLLAILLLTALLLATPLSFARAEGEALPTEPPAQSAAPEATPEAAETPAPTPAAEEPAETPAETPAATPAPEEEPTATATPAPEEEPTATEAPAPEEEPTATPSPGGEDEETPEAAQTGEEGAAGPQTSPFWNKSLAYWERERKSIQLTGDLREDILIIARSQLGYSADRTFYMEDSEGFHPYTRYGDWNGNPFINWCDCFVSFCICYGGNGQYPQESSCYRHMLALKKAGYWREWNSYLPRKGDIVFFSFPEKYPMPTHVGLVEEVLWGEDGQPGQLVTIEGNMSNPEGGAACVRRVVRSLRDVVGYGTYEAGRVYPANCSYRTDGWQIIGPDSPYFVDRPVEEVLRFLSLENTQYYAYWFPDGPEAAAEAPATKPALPTLPVAEALLPELPRLSKGTPKACE